MTKKTYIKNSEYLIYKKRRYSRNVTSAAIRKGSLIKSSCCELCNETTNVLDAHHIDYGKPLEVKWLCRGCHSIVHKDDHEWNPENNIQTEMPWLCDKYQSVTVSFTLPVLNFLAIEEESKKSKRSISDLVKEQIIKTFPIDDGQMEFEFHTRTNDNAQQVKHERICDMAQNEGQLFQPELPLFFKIRRQGDHGMHGMDASLFHILDSNGADSRKLHRNRVN